MPDIPAPSIRAVETLLRDNPGVSLVFHEADSLIPQDRFAVGIPCPGTLPLRAGYGAGKAWGWAGTLDAALGIAEARRDVVREAA